MSRIFAIDVSDMFLLSMVVNTLFSVDLTPYSRPYDRQPVWIVGLLHFFFENFQ